MTLSLLKNHEFYMEEALKLARRAATLGEVPVGALIVKEGRIFARAHNRRENQQSPTAHAELLAIEGAARELGTWRLTDTQLYITLEPCLMCWGAILLARIPRVIFGAMDPKAGVCGSVLKLHEGGRFNHHPEVISGIKAKECGKILSDFFRDLREKGAKAANPSHGW